MSPEVRSAVPAEAAAVALLAARTFPLACPPELDREHIDAFIAAQLSEQRFAEHLAAADHRVLVVDGADGPVGYALLLHGIHAEGPVQWRERRSSYLSKLYVAPDGHGGPIAGALLAAVRADAATAGTAGVWLNVNRDNRRAKRFYAKSGFVLAGEKPFTVGSTTFIDDVLVLDPGA
ncbi:GCN5-related N-acetyltransferase OS=Tsukamurella paurometabola (strain ATCC 8368 / DSM / CCUG 35730 / CIP 100753 / JCM 10117 / KCTC 9821 / NBRC 16120 /NCIMB 702349 / NCTC 13040) OX=521096 GN=Tpau_0785 PE=4 SV=1 [Tsukamurella paurometabola]|uniref:GCN5-related N-acetyltransferase n=1 Tax=Tsukamurella paurometabola (strain ATCC 8368 / DSM 20162 / CCUG 35730 / CIP 100753 / JCM 10117 / KCTC 9821 / NBRC 16120 / NCIMB 702349 / NCTC 13040) TaxID=521096 RepID=D5UTR7_TSUPD|nr:GNAT family N-acetyltransferase [Tsukamurella paurometabola]ADG77421.1 GCN5-related N-acetyltransferase [Tsukamurella paurometabola DSM 20162]SUP26975.1 ribosomal-protein-alanine acetyltransferase [Tsukamurella paurometabola]